MESDHSGCSVSGCSGGAVASLSPAPSLPPDLLRSFLQLSQNPPLTSFAGFPIIKHFFNDVRLLTDVIGRGNAHQWIEKNKQKPYVRKFVQYLMRERGVSEPTALTRSWELYSGGGSVRLFLPAVASHLVRRFGSTHMLDFCAGWGGRLLGAVASGCRYTGYDTNLSLVEPYEQLRRHFDPAGLSVVYFRDSSQAEFETGVYDIVLTSPPYWKTEKTLTEKYEHMPQYLNETDFNVRFLIPVIKRAYSVLKKGGAFCISTYPKQYAVICEAVGRHADDRIPYPRRGRSQKAGFEDLIYIWIIA